MPEPGTSIVISNTSPLLYLHRIGRFDLFRQLYGRIHVPRQVATELEIGSDQGLDVPRLTSFDWIELRDVAVPWTLEIVPDLGPGETSVIALAMDSPAGCLVILDDRLARQIAALHALRITGTAGLIVKAKQRGLIPHVRPLFDKLTEAGFYLRPAHVEMLCRLAGE